MTFRIPAAYIVAIFACLSGCSDSSVGKTEKGRTRVLASIPPLACFARNVAGDRADVDVLLQPGISPHEYALSPRDLKRIADADLILMNGLGLDEWLGKAVQEGGDAARIIELGEKLPVLESMPEEGVSGSKEEDVHGHGGVNPHVWLDPERAIAMVELIRDELVARDPAGEGGYRKRASEYTERLKKLDEETASALARWKGHPIVTFHDAFPYFADRYGLRIAAVFAEFPGKEPSPKYLQRLEAVIRGEQIKVLFAEPQYSPRLISTVAADTGAKVAELDPMDTGDSEPGLYERVTRANVAAVIGAFDGSK